MINSPQICFASADFSVSDSAFSYFLNRPSTLRWSAISNVSASLRLRPFAGERFAGRDALVFFLGVAIGNPSLGGRLLRPQHAEQAGVPPESVRAQKNIVAWPRNVLRPRTLGD